MRWSIVALFCLLMIFLAPWTGATEPGKAYIPLTLAEATKYVAQHPDLAAKDVMKLDAIVHAPGALVSMPSIAVLISGRDAGISWPDPITVEIAGVLRYHGTPRPILVRNVVPQEEWWVKPLWGAGGMLLGWILDEVGHLVLR